MDKILPFFLKIVLEVDFLSLSFVKVSLIGWTTMSVWSVKCALGWDGIGELVNHKVN